MTENQRFGVCCLAAGAVLAAVGFGFGFIGVGMLGVSAVIAGVCLIFFDKLQAYLIGKEDRS